CAQAPRAAPDALPPAGPYTPPPVVLAPEPASMGDAWGTGEGWGVGADGQFWVSAEFALGWFRGDQLPPLVTSSPPGTPRLSAGVVGLPTTAILFGNSTVNDDLRTGFRLGAGYWFTPSRCVGLDVGFMMLESQAKGF